MKKDISLVLVVLMILSVPAAAEQARPKPYGDLQLSSDALGAIVIDKTIEIMMRDGTYVRGEVTYATQYELFVNVKKCEPKGRYKGPEAVIRSSDIAVVQMRQNGTIAAPVALGVLGGILGAVGASYVAYSANMQAASSVMLFSLGAAGGATCGALLGRKATKKTVTINVVSR